LALSGERAVAAAACLAQDPIDRMTDTLLRAFTLAFGLLLSASQPGPGLAQGAPTAIELGPMAACTIGQTCFVQQWVDFDAGPGATDPFCGIATYDGHSGTDLRVLSMRDVERGVDVLALADGTVLRMRDGQADRLVVTEADKAAVANTECGNGVVIAHPGGYETQYCHLRKNSVLPTPGETVRKGQRIGQIGASGMAQFPHVHITVRHQGKVIDPLTGRAADQACSPSPDQDRPLFDPAVAATLGRGEPQVLAAGVAGAPLVFDRLVIDGPPPTATPDAQATVGWGWLINLNTADRLTIRLRGSDGAVISENQVPAFDRPKATYMAFAGRRRAPIPGTYTVELEVRRGDATILSTKRTVEVR
jgi:murein DD-endopeptidase MepM/ murein hydrolase activator NlpD